MNTNLDYYYYYYYTPKSMRILLIFSLYIVNNNAQQAQLPANNEQPFASILYTAVVRGKVALPCDITAPTSDDSVALALWYKDDFIAPMFTLDARKGPLEQARTSIAPSLERRAYFNLHNRPAFLQIDPIRLADAGEYRCRVDFKKARTVNTVISLKVIVPPDEPIITNMEGNDIKGLIGPYNEGDKLKLICITNGGKPRPSLTWWKDDNIIDETFEYNDKDVTTNVLTIPSLGRHYLLSNFMCQAVNNNITVPSSTSVTLDLNMKPTEVHIKQLSPILVADKETTFECNTYGSRPKAILYWLFDGQRFNTPLTGDHQTRTTIAITPKKSHNAAWLTCIAENTRIPNSTISDQLQLDVQYIPHLSLELGTSTISLSTIQEGNDIFFDCHINSNPRPSKPIIWRFNGNILNQKQGIIQSNQTLVLQKVSRTQSGVYQCEASNNQGISLSNTINLTIRYAPVCKSSSLLVYGVSLHETIQLKCVVDANPSKVSFQWKFQKNIDLFTFSTYNDTSSILNYAAHGPEQYGDIDCIAKNDVGLQQKPCSFHTTTSGPPNLRFKCNVFNQSDNSLTIKCSPNLGLNENTTLFKPYNNSPPRAIFVYPESVFLCQIYKKEEPYPIMNISKPILVPYHSTAFDSHPVHNNHISFNLANLEPATHYRLKCFSAYSKGESNPIWLNAETTQSAQKLIDSNNSSILNDGTFLFTSKPFLLVILIAILVIICILIILGIITVIRIRRTALHINITSTGPDASSGTATMFNDEEEECCCDDDCCDEMLLTSTIGSESHHITTAKSKGPPDIIPAIGYLTSSLDKKYISFDYPENPDISINTAYTLQTNINKISPTKKTDLRKSEFNKTPRVDLIAGSPKFESAV